jgi:hypothetical protein
MSAYLLTLADLHAAAPGVFDVIFGADGDFLLAPMFRPPLWHADGYWIWTYTVDDLVSLPVALDLRIPTVAARSAGLCSRVPFTEKDDGVTRITRGSLLQQAMREVAWGAMRNGTTKALAALTLALAPRIAALKDAK